MTGVGELLSLFKLNTIGPITPLLLRVSGDLIALGLAMDDGLENDFFILSSLAVNMDLRHECGWISNEG